jgi:hypothetical protein
VVQDADNLPTTLVIGADDITDARCVNWADVPKQLPSAFQYNTVLVVPGPNSAERQALLRDLLRAELGHRLSGGTRVLWVLNAHCIPSIAADLGLGTLIELRALNSGSVHSLVHGLEVPRDRLHYGIDGLSVKALELAYWERPDHRSQIAVAAGSADRRWFLIPPAASYMALTRRQGLGPSPVASAAAILVVLFALAAIVFDRTRATFEDYDRSVRLIGDVVWGLPLPEYDTGLSTTWSSPDAHMAIRLLHERRDGFDSVIEQLDPSLSPYEIARRHAGSEESPETYLALAAIAGDLPAAYRIATSLPIDSWQKTSVQQLLTQSLWQTAVEQLHELDFDAAGERTRVYLDASGQVLQGAEYPSDLAPQRIRTLAYILEREHASGRIRSLCNDPDVIPASFARLHTGSWAYSVPTGEPTGLAERRARNRVLGCEGQTIPAMDYRLLEDLGVAERHSDALCSAFPLECEFVELRESLFGAEAMVVTADLSHQVLDFAGDCSYLSDDAVWVLLTAVEFARWEPGSVRGAELWPALACAEDLRGDMNRILEGQIEELPCELLSADASGLARRREQPLLAQRVIERCEL